MIETAAPGRDRIRRMGGGAAVVVRAGRLHPGRTRDPAAGRAVPRPLRRRHPQEPLSHHRRHAAKNSACGPTSPFRWRGIISPPAAPASRQGFAISGRCSAIAAEPRANSCRPASNPSGGRIAPPPTPRCSRSASRPPPPSASTDVDIRTGDVALFNALIDALELFPVWRRRLIKDFNRKISLDAGYRAAHGGDRLDATTNIRACWPRSQVPTARRRWRW